MRLPPIALRLFKVLVMPPLLFFALAVVGALVHRWRPRLGKWLVVGSIAGFFVLSLPIVAAALTIGLQRGRVLDLELLPQEPQAIVVLGADLDWWAPEYGGSSVGPLTLQRLRYAARIARRTGLPILVGGGPITPHRGLLADHMADVLREDFGVQVRWRETRSLNTRQNLHYAAAMLERAGITRVFLVTHGWHMRRAVGEAERRGLEVVPAPTSLHPWPNPTPFANIPSMRALRESTWALHEWLGTAWYALSE